MAKSTSSITSGLFFAPQNAESPMTPQDDARRNTRCGKVNGNSHKSVDVAESSNKPEQNTRGNNKTPLKPYHTQQGNHEGLRTRRMCVAMPDDAYTFIRREAIRHGMTNGEYLYSLALAAAEKEIVL